MVFSAPDEARAAYDTARDVARAEGGESVPAKTYHGPFMPKPSTPKPSTPTPAPAQADPLSLNVTFGDLQEIARLVCYRMGAPGLGVFHEVISDVARTRAEGGRE